MEVFANPESVAVGQITAVTATGLGGLATAGFGLNVASGAALSSDGSTYGSDATVKVSSGSALVYFKASEPGTYAVDVTDGETPLGNTTITVTAEAPTTGPQLVAASSSVPTGQPVTITATNLGGLETADFGLGDGSSGATVDPTTARVADGTATTTFTATQPGTYTVDVTNGETPLASVQITVTAASTSPTPTLSPTATPSPAPADGASAAVVWTIVIVAILLLLAAVLVSVIVVRRRRGPSSPAA